MPYRVENKICPECSIEFKNHTNVRFCSKSCGTLFICRERRKIQINDEGELLCSDCKIYKNENLFNRCKTFINRKGREFKCKKCAYSGKRKRIYTDGEDLDRYLKGVLNKINYRQKKKYSGLKTDLSADDLKILYNKQNKKCAISNIEMTCFLGGRGIIDTNISVDRITSTKGYTIDNVHLVTHRVNIMKGNLELKEFLKICKIISKNEL